MNLIVRENGIPNYRLTRKMNREEAFEELKENVKNTIIEHLKKVDNAFQW